MMVNGSGYQDDGSLTSSCVVAVVTHNGMGNNAASNRNSRMYEDDGVAVDELDDEEATDKGVGEDDEEEEEEILDVEDLLKTKSRGNVQLVEIGTESGFHDIYDRKVTFYGNEGDVGTDDNNNSSSQSNKTDKRKSGGSSHSSFSSSSTSSGIISANNEEFKIIMKNNYECTLMMVNNHANDEEGAEEEAMDQRGEEPKSVGGGIRGFRMRQNGYGTLKTAGHRPTTDREFNKRMSFSGDMAEMSHGGDNDQQPHAVYFSGSQNVMNQSFISADGVTRVLVVDGKGSSKRDDEHHIPKCMKMILGW